MKIKLNESKNYKLYILSRIYNYYKKKYKEDLKCLQLTLLTDLLYYLEYNKHIFIDNKQTVNYDDFIIFLYNDLSGYKLEDVLTSKILDPHISSIIKIIDSEFGILSTNKLELIIKNFMLIIFNKYR